MFLKKRLTVPLMERWWVVSSEGLSNLSHCAWSHPLDSDWPEKRTESKGWWEKQAPFPQTQPREAETTVGSELGVEGLPMARTGALPLSFPQTFTHTSSTQSGRSWEEPVLHPLLNEKQHLPSISQHLPSEGVLCKGAPSLLDTPTV